MAKLGHPDGEINLTKGAASTGIIQCVSGTIISVFQLICRFLPTHHALLKRSLQLEHPDNPSSSNST